MEVTRVADEQKGEHLGELDFLRWSFERWEKHSEGVGGRSAFAPGI